MKKEKIIQVRIYIWVIVVVVVVVRLASGSDVFFLSFFFLLDSASLRWLPKKAMLFALSSDCF